MHRPHPPGGAAGEARDLVVGVGDDLGRGWKHTHVETVHVVGTIGLVGHALLAGQILHAFANEAFGFGVQHQLGAQGFGRALTGVVVWRGANTPA